VTSEPVQGQSRLLVEPLASHHDRKAFSCGTVELDAYLQRFAAQNTDRNLAATSVLISAAEPARILGYYTLSNYTVSVEGLSPQLAKGMPTRLPLPATLLGRLAIHQDHHGQGLGKSLLLHALRAALRAGRISASIGVVVDAMDDSLVNFYMGRGFVDLIDKPRHLIMPMKRIQALFPEDAVGVLGIEAITQRVTAVLTTAAELSTLTRSDPGVPDDRVRELIGELLRQLTGILGPISEP
jgi:GNAT superfamily N-acetyltransferase